MIADCHSWTFTNETQAVVEVDVSFEGQVLWGKIMLRPGQRIIVKASGPMVPIEINDLEWSEV